MKRHKREMQPGITDFSTRTVAGTSHQKTRAVYLLGLMLLIDALMILLYWIGLQNENDAVTRLFHVDIEKNVPSTYAAVKLFLAGFAAFFCIPVDSERRFNRMTYRDVWLITGTVLILMSFDEFFSFHEKIDIWFYRLKIITDEVPLGGYAWPWTILGAVFALVVGGFVAWLLYRVFAGRRWLFWLLALSGAVFVFAAIGVENYDYYSFVHRESAGTNFIMGLEELLEMVAVSLVTFVFLRYRGERLLEGD